MASSKTCSVCHGPLDALHTQRECAAMQRIIDYDETARAHLATVGSIIDCAGGGVGAAMALLEKGWLQWKA